MNARPPASASTNQCILHWSQIAPANLAMIEPDRSYGFGDLAIAIVQYTMMLRASGVRPGMLVALECRQRYLHFILIQACEIVGATSISLVASEIEAGDAILSRCDFVVSSVALPPGATARAGRLHLTQAMIDRIAGVPVGNNELTQLDSKPPPDQVLRLIRTSGSTGRPKLMAMSGDLTERLLAWTARRDDSLEYDWNFINLYNFSLRSAYMETAVALRFGCTAVSAGIETVFDDIRRFRQSCVTLLAGDSARLATMPRPVDWDGPYPCILIIKGGMVAPMVRQSLLRDVGTHVSSSYGATEVYRISNVDEDGIGTLFENVDVQIVDDKRQPLPPGTPGLVEARSTTQVDGYLWDEAMTREAFVDGWYRTNDLGSMIAPNRLVIHGRADDILNIGGVKYTPYPLEDSIRRLAGVLDVALVTSLGPHGAEEINVILEVAESASLAPIDTGIRSILQLDFSFHSVWIAGRLPRTTTGKIQRRTIRDWLIAPSADRITRLSTAGYTNPHRNP